MRADQRDAPRLRGRVRRWPRWVVPAAGLWSFGYGLAGLYWALGGAGFPFGSGDPLAEKTFLAGARPGSTGFVIAGLGLGAALVAAIMMATAGRQAPRLLRGLLTVVAATAAVGLLLFIADARVLIATAYALPALIGAPFGWPPVDFFEVALPWPVQNQFLCVLGGLAWAGATLSYRRSARGACGDCGRGEPAADEGWTAPEPAARWGRAAVYVAAVVPFTYALERFLWAFRINVGIDDEVMTEVHESGLWVAGVALAAMATVGAVLTFGLVRPWGETFPRWMVGLAGRRVPIPLAMVPASLVTVGVLTTGLQYYHIELVAKPPSGLNSWIGAAPGLLMPVWGGALAAATLAYYLRRRGRCRSCGRGSAQPDR
ncbi:hypothetical protein [Micromonospora sp. NPDC005220]|uniref:hypothetical protein n=1 Tax=Micromonospora sp. NPDC005220 TaxID=3155589 RepID=UPI0033AB422A